MQVNTGGTHTHHNGLLAGASAGAVAVVAVTLIAWRAVSRIADVAAPIVGWALVVLVVARVAYEVWVLFLRARHHAAHPETLVRQPVRAEVIPAPPPAAIPGAPVAAIEAQPVAALPPGTHHTWRLPNDPEAAIAVIRAIKAEGLAPGGQPR